MKKLTKAMSVLGVSVSLALPMASSSTVLADEGTTTFEVSNPVTNTQGLFDQKTMIKQAGTEFGIGGGGGAVMDYNNPKAWPSKPWCPSWLCR